MTAFPWLLRWQQKAGIHWHRSPHCLASAEWPRPRSQHPRSSLAFSAAALTCGNWKGKLRTTQRNKGQCHPQPSHLGNQLCAELGCSLHALHSKYHKTKLSGALYFAKCSSFCTASPHSFAAFLSVPFSGDLLPPSLGTCFHAADWWLQRRFHSCHSWAPRCRIPSPGFVRMQKWVAKREATSKSANQPDPKWKVVDASHLRSSPLPCG